ncbi:MAG: hypothetical protein KF724_02485 [Phycisphaeraceae bacterium]|nr:hypothetical protein [Phycisphaeraceae bacterium]
MCVTRSLLRWSLIAGLGLGAVALVVGPQRVGAAMAQIRSWGQNTVDRFVEDPVALRRQLEQLGAEYPGRIGQLRGEMAQLDRQIHQLEQDCEISRRVVAMTTADLDQVDAALAGSSPAVVRTRLGSSDGSSLRAEAKRIQQIRGSHQDRLHGGERQLTMLRDQRAKLGAVLSRLEREHADFQIKLATLDRQIDAVGRNQRLIQMAQEQAKVLAEYERGTRVGNLGQLEGRLEQIRIEQEAKLEVLLRADDSDPYESAAREALRSEPATTERPVLPAASLQAKLSGPAPVGALRP